MLSSDGYLIRQCLNGDAAAFGILVDRYRQSVFGLAFSRLSDFQTAEDIAQEVFFIAYQKLRSLKHWDSFSAWLYSITVNLCRNELKARARRPDREYLDDRYMESVEHSIQAHEQKKVQRMVCEALSDLPQMYREVLSLYYLSGMRSREIAEFLGTQVNTIDQRLHRARGMLKGEMLSMMHSTFAEAEMQRAFTFHVMELVKRTQVQPTPYTKAVPWMFSATGGIILTVLMFWGTLSGYLLFGKLGSSSLQGEIAILDTGEIPVTMLGNMKGFFLPDEITGTDASGSAIPRNAPTIRPDLNWTVADGNARMVAIPASGFEMGSGVGDEQPVHTVYLGEFQIDQYEVTVGQYRKFVQESGYSSPNWAAISQHSPTDNHPMIYVSWYDAQAYCEWAGKRLPTEAEWEKAARGGLRGEKYPWGDSEDATQANFDSAGTVPVGSYSPNHYGLYDMSGNVYEWCSDWYDENYYPNSSPINPTGPEDGTHRVARGASWINRSGPISGRGFFKPTNTNKAVGFRCVND